MLIHKSEVDILDDVKVPVEGETPDDDLLESVNRALENTVLHMLDGNKIHWRKEDGNFVMGIVGGFPEMPVGPGQWVPPYRTREEFVESDGGLMDQLPDGWSFDLKTNHEFVFFKEN